MERCETCGVKLDRHNHRKHLLDGVVQCQECAMIPDLVERVAREVWWYEHIREEGLIHKQPQGEEKNQ